MDWREKLRKITENAWFQRVYASAGTVLIILSFFIVVDPEPFLKFGYGGVFVFNLFGPGTILIPRLALEMDVLSLAGASAAGMAINDSLSWIVGYGGRSIVKPGGRAEKVRAAISKYGVWALVAYSILPFPFDFVGLIAGYLKFPYTKMLGAAFVGKIIRFTALGLGTNWLVGIM